MKDETGEIFPLEDIAAYLKVDRRTVCRLAAAKKILGFTVGGTGRFRKAGIEQWIAAQSQNAGGRAG